MKFKIPSKEKRVTFTPAKLAKENYSNWREINKKQAQKSKNNREGFEAFIILNHSFRPYLSQISNGAIKLYLFYNFVADNKNSESWYSIEKIAEELSVVPRSVEKWNSELLNLGLIYREATNHSSMSTFLLPLSNYTVVAPNGFNIDEHIQILDNVLVEGSLTYVFHLFQWKEEQGNEYKPVHRVVYAFKRESYKEATLINTIFKFIVEERRDLSEYKLDKGVEDFTDEVFLYSFDTPVQGITGSSIIGIAISQNYDLDGPVEDLNQILSELANNYDGLTDTEVVPKATIIKDIEQ